MEISVNFYSLKIYKTKHEKICRLTIQSLNKKAVQNWAKLFLTVFEKHFWSSNWPVSLIKQIFSCFNWYIWGQNQHQFLSYLNNFELLTWKTYINTIFIALTFTCTVMHPIVLFKVTQNFLVALQCLGFTLALFTQLQICKNKK